MNFPPSRNRLGITLIEVTVVVAIVLLLLAILLPALLKAREAFSRTACAANMKQLGIAAHNHNATRGKLPPGVAMPYAIQGDQHANCTSNAPFGPNWAVYLLPYIEQDALYREANVPSYPGRRTRFHKTDRYDFDG